MKIETIPLGPVATNTHIIINNNKAIVIDTPIDFGIKALSFLEKENITLQAVLFTHGHWDHIYGIADITSLNIPIYASRKDSNIIENPTIQESYGAPKAPTSKNKISHYVSDNQHINIIGLDITIIETPGHTEGGVCYLIDNIIFTGDTLFYHSVGRTDFIGGDSQVLSYSIQEKLYTLDDETIVYPGHGRLTTIGEEKLNNPFIPAK